MQCNAMRPRTGHTHTNLIKLFSITKILIRCIFQTMGNTVSPLPNSEKGLEENVKDLMRTLKTSSVENREWVEEDVIRKLSQLLKYSPVSEWLSTVVDRNGMDLLMIALDKGYSNIGTFILQHEIADINRHESAYGW